MKFYDMDDQSFEDILTVIGSCKLQRLAETLLSFGTVSLPFSKVTVESIFESTSIFEFVVQREPFRSNLLTCYCFFCRELVLSGKNDGNRRLTQIIKKITDS